MRGLPRGGLVPLIAAFTLLLATSTTPALGGGRVFNDPAGDGTPDILAVTVSLVDSEVLFEFEFASDYRPAESFLTIRLGTWLPEANCGDSFFYLIQMPGPGRSDVAPVLSASLASWMPAPLPLAYSLAGPRLAIRFPASLVGSPRELSFSATTRTRAPGQLADQLRCANVALAAETAASPADPWLIDLTVAGVVLAGFGLLLVWVARRRVPRTPEGS